MEIMITCLTKIVILIMVDHLGKQYKKQEGNNKETI